MTCKCMHLYTCTHIYTLRHILISELLQKYRVSAHIYIVYIDSVLWKLNILFL